MLFRSPGPAQAHRRTQPRRQHQSQICLRHPAQHPGLLDQKRPDLPHHQRPPGQPQTHRQHRRRVNRPKNRLRRLGQHHQRHQPRLPALRLRRRPIRSTHRTNKIRSERLRCRDWQMDHKRPYPLSGWGYEFVWVYI